MESLFDLLHVSLKVLDPLTHVEQCFDLFKAAGNHCCELFGLFVGMGFEFCGLSITWL